MTRSGAAAAAAAVAEPHSTKQECASSCCPPPPPPLAVVPLQPLSAAAAAAREVLRERLAQGGPNAVGSFDTSAWLEPDALANRVGAVEALAKQLRIDLWVPGAPALAEVGVCEDAVELVAKRADAQCSKLGWKVTLTLAREASCPMLHLDRVRQRAICTLLGNGTEWLTDQDSPKAMATKAADLAADWSTSKRLKAELESGEWAAAAERECVLVRGSKWGEATEAYLHRSPLIGPGQFRLVLKVDEVREDGPAPWQSA